MVKKYNCHYPGCWRVGNHPAADGQFSLCYLHHPDYQGKKPTRELIHRLHQEHLERQAALLGKVHEAHEHRAGKATDKAADKPATANGTDDPARHVKSR